MIAPSSGRQALAIATVPAVLARAGVLRPFRQRLPIGLFLDDCGAANGPPMADSLQIRILEGDHPTFEGSLPGVVELGRQQAGEPEPYTWLLATGTAPARLVVARADERDNVSRHHALLEPLTSGRVRLTNHSKAPLPCTTAPGGAIAPGAAAELAPPFSLSLAGRTIAVGPVDSGGQPGLHSLDKQTVGPGGSLAELSSRLRSLPDLTAPQLKELIGWLQTVMGVLQSTVGTADFLDKATEALVQIVGLELGRVLLHNGDEWAVAAGHGEPPQGSGPWQPSQHVLAAVRNKKKTFWQSRCQGDADTPSLQPLETVVAAPLLDPAGNVIGALYGERRQAPASPLHAGGKLEAMLVDLLACGVAAGLARQAQEKAALEAQVRFEQFFGPDLARRLAHEPNLLEGRDAVVTLLFCDVQGFSRYSEKLGPAEALRWMNDVLSELSGRVLDEQGVLVDYVGDELLAMWGAPQGQPDQAARAVRAALAMFAALPALNARWQDVVGGPTGISIGISTGPAQVGNTGSKFKFKYGALGNTVNLGSRVQGLTKYLKSRLLITRATREPLGADFLARRVVKARVVNIDEPVDLYEVEASGSEQRRHLFVESEAALADLEAGEFALAARKAGTLLLDLPGDGPLLLTLSRASTTLVQDGRGFDPVWEPPGK
jgi:adenylate cyclase